MIQCIHLLTESGDKLLTELGDFIVISCFPVPEDEHRGAAKGWKKRLLDEKLWMDKQDEMFLKIANEDDLEVVHVLTDFLSRN